MHRAVCDARRGSRQQQDLHSFTPIGPPFPPSSSKGHQMPFLFLLSPPISVCGCLTSDNSITLFILPRSAEATGPARTARAGLLAEGNGKARSVPHADKGQKRLRTDGSLPWTKRSDGQAKRNHPRLAPRSGGGAFTVINLASSACVAFDARSLPPSSSLFLPLPFLNRRHLSHPPARLASFPRRPSILRCSFCLSLNAGLVGLDWAGARERLLLGSECYKLRPHKIAGA